MKTEKIVILTANPDQSCESCLLLLSPCCLFRFRTMRTLELEQGETSRSALDFQARVLEQEHAAIRRLVHLAPHAGAGTGRVSDSGGGRAISHHARPGRLQLADRGAASGGQTPRPPSKRTALPHAKVEYQQAVKRRCIERFAIACTVKTTGSQCSPWLFLPYTHIEIRPSFHNFSNGE
jgi:hypothetical protein